MHWEQVGDRNRLVLDDESDVSRARIVLSIVGHKKLLNGAILQPNKPLPQDVSYMVAGHVWQMAVEAAAQNGTPMPPPLNGNTTREQFDQALVGCDAMVDDITSSVD